MKLDPHIRAAVERVRLAAELQELTGTAKPTSLRANPKAEGAIRRVLDDARARGRLSTSEARRLRRAGVEVGDGPATHSPQAEAVAGYATSAASEDAVVRLTLLLRLLGRRREALDLLVRRVESGLESPESRRWLADLLVEGREKKAAVAIGGSEPGPPRRAAAKHRGRLRYGIVMLTLFDSPIFRSSLRSLVESDYGGEIVVVEDGYAPEDACRSFCESLSVRYVKRAKWEGSAPAVNEGIEALPDDLDVIVFAHNDVLWPPEWFPWFDRAWERAFDGGHVGLLNLSYLQLGGKLRTLTELFTDGRYDHLRWLLEAMREIPELKDDRIQASCVTAAEGVFGLARDPWNDWVPDARFMTGRFSVAASFPRRTWVELGGFDPALPYGFDLELQHDCVAKRRWMLFVNNPPLIHHASTDTRHIDAKRAAEVAALHEMYPYFERKYGWLLEHFLNVWFSESTFVHRDEIVAAANADRLEDVDFVFDDARERFRTRRLANCELTWCRTRAICRYTSPEALAEAFARSAFAD